MSKVNIKLSKVSDVSIRHTFVVIDMTPCGLV